MAGRRGIWLVLIFIVLAVMVSAAGLIATAVFVRRAPHVASNSALMLRVSGDLLGWRPGRQWGGLLNALAVLLFLFTLAWRLRR